MNLLRVLSWFFYLALIFLIGAGLLSLIPFIKGYLNPFLWGHLWSLGLILAGIIFCFLWLYYLEKILLKRKKNDLFKG